MFFGQNQISFKDVRYKSSTYRRDDARLNPENCDPCLTLIAKISNLRFSSNIARYAGQVVDNGLSIMTKTTYKAYFDIQKHQALYR